MKNLKLLPFVLAIFINLLGTTTASAIAIDSDLLISTPSIGIDPILLILAGAMAFIIFRLISVLGARQGQRDAQREVDTLGDYGMMVADGLRKAGLAIVLLLIFSIIFAFVTYWYHVNDATAFLVSAKSNIDLALFVIDQSLRGGLADFLESFDIQFSNAEHNPRAEFAFVIFAYRLTVGATAFATLYNGIRIIATGIALAPTIWIFVRTLYIERLVRGSFNSLAKNWLIALSALLLLIALAIAVFVLRDAN